MAKKRTTLHVRGTFSIHLDSAPHAVGPSWDSSLGIPRRPGQGTKYGSMSLCTSHRRMTHTTMRRSLSRIPTNALVQDGNAGSTATLVSLALPPCFDFASTTRRRRMTGTNRQVVFSFMPMTPPVGRVATTRKRGFSISANFAVRCGETVEAFFEIQTGFPRRWQARSI